MDLKSEKCIPCQGGVPILQGDELQNFGSQVPGWVLYDNNTKLKKEFVFDDFSKALSFVNRVAGIAEEEGHHPNIYLYDYKKVRIELYTHAIQGLHKNDFILASKIDNL